ncbi:MAG: rRNA maturation RNase YbeY [Flavipsychrobacter sp.]
MPIHYYEQEVNAKLQQRRKLSAYLNDLIREHLEVKQVNLTYIFCNDDYLLTINKQFLNHDTYTDIVTFDLTEQEDELIGELYISTDRIAENAETHGTTYQEELHRVIFHGALHLCGFKDKTAKDQKEMRQMEDHSLKAYFKN